MFKSLESCDGSRVRQVFVKNDKRVVQELMVAYQPFFEETFGFSDTVSELFNNLLVNDSDELFIDMSYNDGYYSDECDGWALWLSYNLTKEQLVATAEYSETVSVVDVVPMTIDEFKSKLTTYFISDFESEYSPSLAIAATN
uniref:hypothetical protein n=1 Tax=Streptococcus pluranimalium TaxID=82348 RepID=UPI003F68D9D3